jgi:hypothetical protein
MSRAPQTFKQGDIARALKAVMSAGQKVARIEIAKDGRIVMILGGGKAGQAPNLEEEPNDWADAK